MSRTLALLLLSLALAACAGVLGIKPRQAGGEPFPHRTHVTKGVSCTTCHASSVSPSVPTTATCTSCHTKPHDDRPCLDCHSETHERQRIELAREHLRFTHADHKSTGEGECVKCHTQIGDDKPGTLLPTMAACFRCHEHEKEFATRKCDGCHVDLPAEHTLPESHVPHDGDWIREHGVRAASARDLCQTCHSERQCLSCHGVTTAALPSKLAFDDAKLPGLHRAGFRSRHAEEARGQPGLCTTCHSESSCKGCHDREHVSAGTARSSPHPAGWVGTRGSGHGPAARIDPASCAACHGGAGEQLCVGCHRTGGPGGNPHGPGFSSRKSKTRDVPCRLCHVVSP